jgi:hypothetical protein
MEIKYRFAVEDGTQSSFLLRLDPKDLSLLPTSQDPPPDWARLGNEKCSHCPLSEDRHPYCPIACNLAGIIHEFARKISFTEADISIETNERQYSRRAPLQQGISSLIGIVMVTSGCPHMDKLRPMVYTHLPFATSRETTYRAISMYLLAQYFRRKEGLAPDWDMKGLVDIYSAVRQVNIDFLQRLKTMRIEDANLNAIVKLDCFAITASSSIVDDTLQGVRAIFQAYLGRPGAEI